MPTGQVSPSRRRPRQRLVRLIVLQHAQRPHTVACSSGNSTCLPSISSSSVQRGAGGVAEIHALQYQRLLQVAGGCWRRATTGTRTGRSPCRIEIDHVALDAASPSKRSPAMRNRSDRLSRTASITRANASRTGCPSSPSWRWTSEVCAILSGRIIGLYMKESAAGAADGPIVAGSRRR